MLVERICRRCNLKTVLTQDGPAVCEDCKRARRTAATLRYRRTEQGTQKRKQNRSTPEAKAKELAYARYWRQTPRGKEWHRQARKRYTLKPASLEKIREWFRQWRRSEKGKAIQKVATQNRRVQRNLAGANRLTTEQWNKILERAKSRCYYCKKKVEKLTMDHVVPLSKGGSHTEENIVAACLTCNSRKANRIVLLL